MKKNNKIKYTTVIYSVIILVAVLILILGVLNYGVGIKNNFTKTVNKALPFPAATVNYLGFISLNSLAENVDSSRRFYENQDFSAAGLRVDFATEDGAKRLKIKEKNILNKMIENVIIEKLAKERGIKLNDELISQEVERKLLEFGNQEDVKNNLMRLYGWDIEKFKQKIVKPEMYKEKLIESFIAENTNFENAKNKIEDIANQLSQKANFEDLAKKYSDGESAKNGGDMGWFENEQMLPQISQAALQLKKGEISTIIQSSLGFHIIRVDDKKTEDGIPMIKVHQIFVKTPSFADWLMEKEKDFKVQIFLKDFQWNKDKKEVEFSRQDLKNFEDNLIENSSGDVSVFF